MALFWQLAPVGSFHKKIDSPEVLVENKMYAPSSSLKNNEFTKYQISDYLMPISQLITAEMNQEQAKVSINESTVSKIKIINFNIHVLYLK